VALTNLWTLRRRHCWVSGRVFDPYDGQFDRERAPGARTITGGPQRAAVVRDQRGSLAFSCLGVSVHLLPDMAPFANGKPILRVPPSVNAGAASTRTAIFRRRATKFPQILG
jgi:hypothetical protein